MVHHESQVNDKRWGLTRLEVIIIVGIIVVLILMLQPMLRDTNVSQNSIYCSLRLRQIGDALRQYKELFGVLPPAYTVDDGGKPLHSWRTLILPYLGEKIIYDSIDLSKPWDDPANSAVSEQIPGIYKCPSATSPTNRTMYLGVFGKDKCFTGSEERNLQEITDTHGETIVVIEVPEDQGVPWMAPLDADEKLIFSFDAKTKWPHPNLRNAIFVNGSSIHLFNTTSPEELRRMLTIAGGD